MEATATLADSLLEDLDDLSDVEEEPTTNNEADIEELTSEEPTQYNDIANESSKQQNRWINNSQLQNHLSQIATNSATTPSEGYALMTSSNAFLLQLQTEFTSAHFDLQTAYAPKFPELSELLPHAKSYQNAIAVLQNCDLSDLTSLHDALHSEAKLSSNQIITLSVAGSTTSGISLSEEQLRNVNECIQYMQDLLVVEEQLTSYVERHITSLAPNTVQLLGATLTARLVGLVGGLEALVQIPACNLQVLGQVKATSASRAGMGSMNVQGGTLLDDGVAGASVQLHQGILVHCDLVQSVKGPDQRKALKALANKVTLVARCDWDAVKRGRVDKSAAIGIKFRNDLEAKFRKWHEPDKAPVVKALPKPDLTTKKRRGGKRMRRLKEKFEATELMKQADRRAFSTETGEYGDDAMGLTLGMLEKGGASQSGNVRQLSLQANKRKMRQANTKASRKRAAQMAHQAARASAGNANGLVSSMAFTPVQGLELVNPDAVKDRVKEANKKWFGEYAGFQSALPKNESK